MPLDLTELQAITDDYVEKTPIDILFTENVLLFVLMGKGMMAENLLGPDSGELVDGGKMIKVILEYDEAHSGSYGNTTKIPLSKKEIYNAALYRWAGYHAANSIDLDDKVQNSGDAAIVNLTYGKLENIRKTIRKKMGAEIYAAAANGDSFLGLGNMFNTTGSIAYGQIKEDDMPEWKAVANTNAKTMSFALMQEIRRAAKVGQNRRNKPDIYVTTDVLKDAFENSLQNQARYSDHKLAQAGFDNILFSGVPMVPDDNQQANYIDGLNTRFLSIKTHKDYQFTRPVWRSPIDQPDVAVADTRWIGQLVCRNRKAHARYTNVTVGG
jgi:hypothetical protein